MGEGDSYGPTVVLVTCVVVVTLSKLANQSYVNKWINQSKYWVELSKHQWYEHSKIIIYCIYHSFQESLWYRLQVILLSNHSWTTSKFLANIYVKFKYNFKIFMMFSEQKVPLFHLFTGQVYLESNFGHLSSVQNSPIHKKKENLICTIPTTQQHTNCTHYANHLTAFIFHWDCSVQIAWEHHFNTRIISLNLRRLLEVVFTLLLPHWGSKNVSN